jgi:hypothetical protein
MAEETKSPETPEVEVAETEETEGSGFATQEEVDKALGIFDETEEEDGNEEDSETEEPSKEEEAPAEETEEEPKEETEEEPAAEEEKSETEEPVKEPETEATQANIEAELWKKRYSDSQKEYEEKWKPLEGELRTLQTEREQLADIIASNPELSDLFLKTVESREKAPNQAPASQTDSLKEELLAAVRQELSPLFAKQEEEKVQAEKARYEAIEAFEEEHPGLTDADRSNIGQTSAFLQRTLGLSNKEALDRAWVTLYPDKAQEKAVSSAKKEVIARQTQNQQATTQKVPAGSNRTTGFQLSPEQRKVAKKFGMTDEEYAATVANK